MSTMKCNIQGARIGNREQPVDFATTMAAQTTRVLDDALLAHGDSNDPKGFYHDGTHWVAGEAPGTVPKTKAVFHGSKNGAFACGVDLAKFKKDKEKEEADPEGHKFATEKVVFRTQCAEMDMKTKWRPDMLKQRQEMAKNPSTKLQFFNQDDPYGEVDNFYKQFDAEEDALNNPNPALEDVEIDGKPYVEFGADKGGRRLEAGPLKGEVTSEIDIPPLVRVAKNPDVLTIYDHEGNLKKEGDGPLGVAYDAEGIPVPDWEIVDTSKNAAGTDVLDENGRRRGGYRIRGMVKMQDYAMGTRRCYPQWGKRFGLVTKKKIGRFGSYTVAEAKLCLTTEDFGFKLGEDAARAPTPPLIRVRYGEVHNEPESICIYTGLSEVHLSHKEDIKEVHYMLQGLGYVCYNVPEGNEERFWGEGIDVYPTKVYRGDGGVVDNKTQGPTYFSWYYRLPPFVAGLALEGEEGDEVGGPEARLRQARGKRLAQDQEDLNEERLAALRARCKEQATMPWYRDYFPDGEKDPKTGEQINAYGTLPGEDAKPLALEGAEVDDDKE
jgi:hypothetical protein